MQYDQGILDAAGALDSYTRDIRHALHRIPERGFQEFKTHAYLKNCLDAIGIPYTTKRTWIIGTIKGEKPGPTVALRADIDALPIQERTGLPFASEHPGMMHACGHDAHAAMLMGAARLLWEMKADIPGTVRLLFQPAEETEGGAEPMIAAGAMDGVAAVYGLHVAAQSPVGRIQTRHGAMYAATDELFIDILGKSGHGAHPTSGIDAIAIAGQLIAALQTLVSREIDATDSAVITIGSIHGGKVCNIICDEVNMIGTLRTLTDKVRRQFNERIPAFCRGIARTMGGDARVRIRSGYCAALNDPGEADRVLAVAGRLLGEPMAQALCHSSLGGEDFAYYLQKAPGAIYLLGCGADYPAHSGLFVVDDDCLQVGVAMHAALVMDYLTQQQTKEGSK